jgi:hypothetical protein
MIHWSKAKLLLFGLFTKCAHHNMILDINFLIFILYYDAVNTKKLITSGENEGK